MSALRPLINSVSTQAMGEANIMVDVTRQPPADAARKILKQFD
jgi:hypothetical protein